MFLLSVSIILKGYDILLTLLKNKDFFWIKKNCVRKSPFRFTRH